MDAWVGAFQDPIDLTITRLEKGQKGKKKLERKVITGLVPPEAQQVGGKNHGGFSPRPPHGGKYAPMKDSSTGGAFKIVGKVNSQDTDGKGGGGDKIGDHCPVGAAELS